MIKNNKGQVEGVEIYARRINNHGIITSDSKTKIVTDNYNGEGEVSAFSKKRPQFGCLKQVLVGLIITFLAYYFGWN